MDMTLNEQLQSLNGWLAVAALLVVLLGLAHSVLGERFILRRLFRRPDLPHLFGSDEFTKRTLRFAWHLTTVAWWGLAGVLIVLGLGSVRGGLMVVSLTAFLSAVVALIGSRGRHLAWLVLAVIGFCTWLGVRVG